MTRFFVGFFSLAEPKNFAGNRFVQCFRNFLVAKKFMDKKGGNQDFLSKLFCLTVSKNFVGEPFRVSLTSGVAKFYA